MTQTAETPAPQTTALATRRSILMEVANRYGMEPQTFEQTLRETVVPKGCTREQFAAFLVVAREHDLNPLTKEIYAFPAKGGGIVPIVGVDGWIKLMNRHPQNDGIEFDEVHDDKGKLIATTAIVYRKDRTRPTRATEYLAECKRNTDPWNNQPHRMLRHRAMIQAARIAFGFAGIMDEEDFERASMIDVTPPPAPTRQQFAPAAEPAARPTEADERAADRMTERFAQTGDTRAADEGEDEKELGPATEAPEQSPPGATSANPKAMREGRDSAATPPFPPGGDLDAVRATLAGIATNDAVNAWEEAHADAIKKLATIRMKNVRQAITDRRVEINEAEAGGQ
jgi:phage recombination protein Bet